MNLAEMIMERLVSGLIPDKYLVIWADVIKSSSEESLRDILSFIDADPSAVSILTGNLIEKVEALESNDLSQVEKVFAKDVLLVNSI